VLLLGIAAKGATRSFPLSLFLGGSEIWVGVVGALPI